MYGIIYKATNTLTKKVYIGQTIQPFEKRKRDHINTALRGKKKVYYFQKALRKYGAENFQWKQIDFADTQAELNEKEQYWVSFYKADDPQYGYNIQEGGANGKLGEETRRKISENNKSSSPETRRKMREAKRINPVWNKGKTGIYSAETLQKIIEASRNRSPETLRKMSIAHAKLTEAQVREIKTALASGEIQRVLAEKYGVDQSVISNIKRGKAWKHLQNAA